MQIRLKIAVASAALALATIPAFAIEMPADGSKNFSTPGDAPSYFTNETVPESARVDRAATFDKEDAGIGSAVSDGGSAVSVGTETGLHDRHTSAHRSAKHSLGRSRGHGASTHYVKATSSKATRTAGRITATHTYAASGSASAPKGAGRGGTQAGVSKSSPTKHARTGTRQHASAMPPEASPLVGIT